MKLQLNMDEETKSNYQNLVTIENASLCGNEDETTEHLPVQMPKISTTHWAQPSVERLWRTLDKPAMAE